MAAKQTRGRKPPSRRARPAARRTGRGGIRWDRVGRFGLLATLGIILLLYIPPAKRWIEQSGTASHQKAELDELEREHDGLKQRLRALRDPAALEREARRLGMVKAGERAYVIENLRR
jgi:cell division protein FtsB